MPDGAAGLRIQSVSIIRSGQKHNPVYHYGGYFERIRLLGMENPLRAQLVHVGGRDLVQARKPASRVVAIVGRPVCARGGHVELRVRDVNDSLYGDFPGRLRVGGASQKTEG